MKYTDEWFIFQMTSHYFFLIWWHPCLRLKNMKMKLRTPGVTLLTLLSLDCPSFQGYAKEPKHKKTFIKQNKHSNNNNLFLSWYLLVVARVDQPQ